MEYLNFRAETQNIRETLPEQCRERFREDSRRLFEQCPGNCVEIPGADATDLFEPPIVGFASAEDGLFDRFQEQGVIGPDFLKPADWLSDARTVVSFFFPFTKAVRKSNLESAEHPSVQWLYGRIEGQQFLTTYMEQLQKHLTAGGISAVVPALDKRFHVRFETVAKENRQDFHADSSWSERHAAYVCGLGTFGLSRGLITAKGMAGRFASLIMNVKLAPDVRPYTGIYDYCIMCGACVAKCPAGAISLEHGKNNELCNRYLEMERKRNAPRYGCGKCQVGVPCESCSPVTKTRA